MRTISDLHERRVTLVTRPSTLTKLFYLLYTEQFSIVSLIGCNLRGKNSQRQFIPLNCFDSEIVWNGCRVQVSV